jgi:hypothetical protein
VQPLRAATECEVDLVRKRLDHGNGLRPWIPNSRPEFHLCATESHPLTWTSPCEDVTLGYDEIKPLARFLWSVFAGYRKEDIVKKMIDAI